MPVKPWVTFFSQTGSEIYNISQILNKEPDIIVTNKPIDKIDTINQNLLDKFFDKIVFISKKPTIEEYEFVIPENSFITLHGYLRILPPEICAQFEIYNLHPAPLRLYPDLKGFTPQERVYKEKRDFSGNTIHKCIAEVDAGEILAENTLFVRGYSLDQIFTETHSKATELWCSFLENRV
jgi:folate-dependent phosphoribosylglycinamide formyltransferase PurN